MAEQEVWIGSVGPYLFDSDDTYADGSPVVGIRSSAPISVGTPTAPEHAAQYGDLTVRLPAGIICMWSGLLSNIPSGWKLCDGTNSTPDLRDRFIRGCSAGVDPGGTGGSLNHSHSVDVASATSGNPSDTTAVGAGSTDVASATHTHTIDPASVSSSSESSLPPYYTLAFIMKS